MRIVFFTTLLVSFINAGLTQQQDLERYEELVQLITFNNEKKAEIIQNSPKEELVRPTIDSEPLLFLASKYKKEEVFKVLLKKGLNPNVIFNETTLIHYILKSRPKHIALLDLDNVNFLTLDKNGDIPLNFLTEKYNYKHLEPFLYRITNNSNNLETKNKDNMSFLELLLKEKNLKALKRISSKYKIKHSTKELLEYAFEKDIELFSEILKMVEDDRVFHIRNEKNIVGYIMSLYSKTTRADLREKSNMALALIYEHLKEKNRLEFLYSKNDEGVTFIELSILLKNDTIVNLFFRDKKKLPLDHKTLKFAIVQKYNNKNLFSIIPQSNEKENILHSILEEDGIKNIDEYITFFDYEKLNAVDATNKEHFVETAIRKERWDFIFKLFTSGVEGVEINDKYIVSLIEKNVELSHKLIMNTDTNPNLFSDTFLFYLISSDKINKKEKETIIEFFVEKHVKTKKDIKKHFFDKDKRNIIPLNLIELKMPYSNIAAKIKKMMRKVEEEPFLSVYNNKEIPDFYKNSLLKKNDFGTSLIDAAIHDGYVHLDALISDFKKRHPEEWVKTLSFYKKHSPKTYSNLVENGDLTENSTTTSDKLWVGEKTEKTTLLKILNQEKITIKKDSIEFENFIKPLFLYNKPFYDKIPEEFISKYPEALVKLFIKTKQHQELLLFATKTGYNFGGKELGDLAVAYAYPNVDYLVSQGIDLDFKLKNNYTYFDNLILTKNIVKIQKLISSDKNKYNIVSNNLIEPKHILELLFAFNERDVLENIKTHNTPQNNKVFFGEKYKIFIKNHDLKNFKNYFENGFFSHQNIDIYRQILKENTEVGELLKIAFKRDLPFEVKQKIAREIISSGKNELLSIFEKTTMEQILETENFLKDALENIEEEGVKKTIGYLLENKYDIDVNTIKLLYKKETYLLIRNVYRSMTDKNLKKIKKELFEYLLTVKEDHQNLNLFNYVLNKHYKDLSITKKHLIDSVMHKGRFIQLLKMSKLDKPSYQEVFGHLLSKNPKHTMFKELLRHPIGSEISFNKKFNNKHLLEIMIEKKLFEMFNLTLDKIQEEIDKETTERAILALQREEELVLYDKNIAIFSKLISKHKINLVHVLLSETFNLDFIIYSLQNTPNIHVYDNGEHAIFEVFRNPKISDLNKIKLFYIYKNRQINILEKDKQNKSIIHYLADYGIKEDNLYNLLARMPNDVRVRFLQQSGLLSHIVENNLPYTNFIKRNLDREKIEFSESDYPFQLKAIEKKNFELFNYLADNEYISADLEDVDGKTLMEYCIDTKEFTYVDKAYKLGLDVDSDDVEYAVEVEAGMEIEEYLEERSKLLYKMNKYFLILIQNAMFLSILGGSILLSLGIVFVKKIRKKNEKNTKKHTPTPEELRLAELKKKIEAVNSKELKLDEGRLSDIEREFEELNQSVTLLSIDGTAEEEREEVVNFTQADIDAALGNLEDKEGQAGKAEDKKKETVADKPEKNTGEFEISDDLLKQLEEDFSNEKKEEDK